MLFIRKFSTKFKRISIPKAVREQLWLRDYGRVFDAKCSIEWCNNDIDVFNYTVGHNIPVSKGGTNKISNLHCICSRCNSSMGNMYTIHEWNEEWNSLFRL